MFPQSRKHSAEITDDWTNIFRSLTCGLPVFLPTIDTVYAFRNVKKLQWTLVTTTACVSKDVCH